MRIWASLFSLAFCLVAISARAESNYQRSLSVEWEPMENAKSYELEFTPTTEGAKPIKFKADSETWTGKLKPGSYQMRMRAKDKRGVPGDWSAPEAFQVNLETAKLLSPKMNEKMKTDEDEEESIRFQWTAVKGADNYQFELVSEDGQFTKTQTLADTELKLDLPVAKNYTWKILARQGEQIVADATAVSNFTVLGEALAQPEIKSPESKYVREIQWTNPKYATSFEYIIAKKDPQTKKWVALEKAESLASNQIPFKNEYPGGQYRIQVRANSPLRKSSKVAEMKFDVQNGDRSPASEFTQTLRQSIDRTNGWFAIASYLFTQIKYRGVNYEASGGAPVDFPTYGGTGRLGLGYLSKEKPWGILAIADFSGFIIDEHNYTFATAELNSVYRILTGDHGESRIQMGLTYKEIPEVIINGVTEKTEGVGTYVSWGPHLGYEYWLAMTPKLGLQLNAHLYYNNMKITTPNGQELLPSLSTQLGILGSYKINARTTGLMGYAYRLDKASSTSKRDPAKTNTVELQGNYVNLFLEWAL